MGILNAREDDFFQDLRNRNETEISRITEVDRWSRGRCVLESLVILRIPVLNEGDR